MNLSWLRACSKGYTNPGFRELIVSLSYAKSEELFNTKPIRSLAKVVEGVYYKKVRLYCFVPFVLYFVASLKYVTFYAVDGVEPNSTVDSIMEVVCRILVIVGSIYFSVFELITLARDGSDWFFDGFNYNDLLLPFLQLYLTRFGAGALNLEDGEKINETRRALASLASFFLWIKAFYWLRLFTGTSFYIRLIVETLREIKYFMILFAFCLMMFGNAILIMDTGRNPRYT